MAIYDYSKNLVTALVTGSSASFPSEPYLGLLTKMPAPNGTGFAEPTYENYSRIPTFGDGIMGEGMLAEAEYENDNVYALMDDDVSEDTKDVAYVRSKATIKSKEILFFPDIRDENYEQVAVGWALFAKRTGTAAPYLWGQLKNKLVDDDGNTLLDDAGNPKRGIKLATGKVPIVREKDFAMSVK